MVPQREADDRGLAVGGAERRGRRRLDSLEHKAEQQRDERGVQAVDFGDHRLRPEPWREADRQRCDTGGG
jgi:hypothetical protein